MSSETDAVRKLTRPIIGINNRTPQEAQDILFDRIRSHFAADEARQQAEARATSGAGEVEVDLELIEILAGNNYATRHFSNQLAGAAKRLRRALSAPTEAPGSEGAGESQADRDRRMYEQGRRDERAGEPEAFV